MSFRGTQIYVQGQTRHRLNLLARVLPGPYKPGQVLPGGVMPPKQLTADELADQLLNEIMDAKYPVLKELEAQIKVLEEKAAEAIGGTK